MNTIVKKTLGKLYNIKCKHCPKISRLPRSSQGKYTCRECQVPNYCKRSLFVLYLMGQAKRAGTVQVIHDVEGIFKIWRAARRFNGVDYNADGVRLYKYNICHRLPVKSGDWVGGLSPYNLYIGDSSKNKSEKNKIFVVEQKLLGVHVSDLKEELQFGSEDRNDFYHKMIKHIPCYKKTLKTLNDQYGLISKSETVDSNIISKDDWKLVLSKNKPASKQIVAWWLMKHDKLTSSDLRRVFLSNSKVNELSAEVAEMVIDALSLGDFEKLNKLTSLDISSHSDKVSINHLNFDINRFDMSKDEKAQAKMK